VLLDVDAGLSQRKEDEGKVMVVRENERRDFMSEMFGFIKGVGFE
jgi:hypothetical protein